MGFPRVAFLGELKREFGITSIWVSAGEPFLIGGKPIAIRIAIVEDVIVYDIATFTGGKVRMPLCVVSARVSLPVGERRQDLLRGRARSPLRLSLLLIFSGR